jgi:hypothetical protein
MTLHMYSIFPLIGIQSAVLATVKSQVTSPLQHMLALSLLNIRLHEDGYNV